MFILILLFMIGLFLLWAVSCYWFVPGFNKKLGRFIKIFKDESEEEKNG